MNCHRIASLLLVIGLAAGWGLAQESSEGCSVCHRDHYQQWLQSPHARAWKSAEFQAQLKAFGSPEFCAGCHAPISIWRQVNMRPAEGALDATRTGPTEYQAQLREKRAAPREAKDEGVNCGSCHFVEVLWPWGDANETLGPYHTERGHGGKPVPDFDSFKLCGACHGREAEDYRPGGVSTDSAFYHNQTRKFDFASGQADCASCHMPTSQGKLTHLRIFRDLPERTVREHSFVGDRYQKVADQVDVELQNGPAGPSLLVTNRGVGHSVRVKPSTILVLDVIHFRNGGIAGQLEIDFPVAPELAMGESRAIPIDISLKKGDSLRIDLIRKGPNNFRESLLQRTVDW